MPLGNGTGPNGMGPMTGRAAGYCAGYGMPGYMNSGVGGFGRGRGLGLGYGRGMGYGRGFSRAGGWGAGYGPASYAVPVAPWTAAPDEKVERWNLERQAEALASELKLVQERLDALEKPNEPNA